MLKCKNTYYDYPNKILWTVWMDGVEKVKLKILDNPNHQYVNTTEIVKLINKTQLQRRIMYNKGLSELTDFKNIKKNIACSSKRITPLRNENNSLLKISNVDSMKKVFTVNRCLPLKPLLYMTSQLCFMSIWTHLSSNYGLIQAKGNRISHRRFWRKLHQLLVRLK